MKPIIIVIGSLVLLIASVFGYYLFKSNGDFVLAKAMISYEINSLVGKPDTDTVSQTDTETTDMDTQSTEATPTSTHTKDSIYKGNSNNFSDVKKTGSESSYQPKNTN